MKESKVELYERIRRDHRDEGVSIRGLADRYGVHRRTVRQALASATPPPRKLAERASPALGPYKDVICRWLTADLGVGRKQRHTARRVWQRLVDEYDAQVAEPTVRAFVAEVKAELADVAGEVTVAQEHAPGADAEVDFGEFRARIAGQLLVLQLFVMRLSASGRGSRSRSRIRRRRRSSRVRLTDGLASPADPNPAATCRDHPHRMMFAQVASATLAPLDRSCDASIRDCEPGQKKVHSTVSRS